MYPIDRIKTMTPEECDAETRRLAKTALGQFFLIHTIKWALIIGTTRAARKILEKSV